MQFPTVSGSNLLRQKLELPANFEGELNVVLIAFQQWQQRLVDTWLPFVQELEENHAGLCYYELPTIQNMNVLARTFINEGMRAGIPDPTARERTITLYLDKPAFRDALDLSTEDDIHTLVVNRQGEVLWRAQGALTPEKGASLRAAVQAQLRPVLV